MKRIFTLLISLGSIGSAFAQGGHGFDKTSRDMAFIKAPYNTAYTFVQTNSASDVFNSRDREIRQVNRDFDRQIMAVRHNRFLRPMEKEQRLRMLEAQRDQQIRMINDRYNGHYHRNFDGGDHRRW